MIARRPLRSIALVTALTFLLQAISPFSLWAHDFALGGGTDAAPPSDPSGSGPNDGQPPATNPSPEEPSVQGSTDPVDIHRGEFGVTRQDLLLPAGRGPSIDLTFTYRSRSSYNTPFGYGWDMSYHQRIRKLSNNNLVVLRGFNRKDEFVFSAPNTFTAPAGIYDTLLQNPDGTYTLTSKHGEEEFYDVNGLLTRIEDRNGNALTFTYDPAGLLPLTGKSAFFVNQTTGVIARDFRLTRITDATGHTVDFAYTPEGRLDTLTYAGRTIRYGYSAEGDLTSVTTPTTPEFPSGNTTTYAYANHNLTTMTDPKGQTYLTNVYNANDCVTQQTYGPGTSSLRYVSSPLCPTIEGTSSQGFSLTLEPFLARPGDALIVRWTAPAGVANFDSIHLYPVGAPSGSPMSTLSIPTRVTSGTGTLTLLSGAAAGLYEARYFPAGTSTPVATSNTVTVAPSPAPAVTEVTDRNGFRTQYTFDAIGHITRIEQFTDGNPPGEPVSYVTTYEYDANGERTRIVYPRGNATEFTYDVKGNLLEIRRKKIGVPKGVNDPTDLVTAFTYEPNFNFIKTITDPGGNVTTYTYDYELSEPMKGNLRRITYPTVDGVTPQEQFTYNTFGQLDAATDPTSIVTKYLYDATSGYLTQVTEGFGTSLASNRSFSYDAVGNLTTLTDPRDNTTTFTYNALNQLIQVTAPPPFGFVTRHRYDANGNLIQLDRQATTATPGPRPATGTTSPTDDWQSTVYAYTTLDQLESITDDLNQTTRFAYDPSGNRAAITDAKLQTTTYDHDERNLLVKVTDAATPPGITAYRYDANGNLTVLTDAKGNPTRYTYDDFDRLTTTTYADNSFEQYAYDKASNLTQRITPATQTLTYTYDALNRLTSKIAPEETTTYAYDAGSRLTTTADADVALTYTYDALNRVTQVATDPAGALGPTTVGYTYDGVGNRTRLTYPDASIVTYPYDELTRLTAIKDAGVSPLATFTYDALSRRTTLARANGTSTSYAYDPANRLTQLTHTALLSPFTYTYDNVGNRQTLTDPAGLHTYTYDPLQQLTQTDEPAGFAFQDAAYTYDPVGNRTQVINGGTTSYSPNNLNQYTVVGTTNLSYDPNGNLTNDGTRTYTYDSESRLLSASGAFGSASYTYDPLGRRLTKTVNGLTTRFLYDGDQILAEADTSGTLTATYLFGPGIDEPLVMERAGTKRYYHQDGLGSIIALTDAAGALVESYRYDVFGQPQAPSSVGNRYLFTGREYDQETGLYYYRRRYYDPGIGRFLSRDPLADVLNLYTYVENNPVTLIDPDGLTSVLPGGGLLGGGLRPGDRGLDLGPQGPIIDRGPAPTPRPDPGDRTPTKSVGGLQGTGQPGILTAEAQGQDQGKDKEGKKGGKKGDPRKADEIIQKEKRGRVREEFPKEYLDKTFDEIDRAANRGDPNAKKARKLLSDRRFDK